MESIKEEMLPVSRNLPSELPSGGLNQGDFLLGTGSNVHFDWDKKVNPYMWEFATNYGVRREYTGQLDHQDIMLDKEEMSYKSSIKPTPLKDEGLNASSVWEATQDHVWGLRNDREKPFFKKTMNNSLGMETGIHEAGFNEDIFKMKREYEFLQGSLPYPVDDNRVEDGRVANHNIVDEGGKPTINFGEEMTDLPQNERRAVRVV